MTALLGLEARLKLARLYLCTDARQRQGDLAEFLAAAFAGGVDIVQIRQKNLSRRVELEALQVARAAAEPHQGLVCVNDSAELAGAFGADLLHLGQTDGSARRARRKLHRYALIGRSTHAAQELDRAVADDDVDYFCAGPVYATPTKPDYRAVGLELIRYATQVAPPGDLAAKPWFAIGGVNAETVDEVLEAGARRICVVRAITEASDPQAAARTLADRLRRTWRSDPAMERYTFAAAAAPGRER